MNRIYFAVFTAIALGAGLVGCEAGLPAPTTGATADPVARLIVGNAEAILARLRSAQECGFANPNNGATTTVTGTLGEAGEKVITLPACELSEDGTMPVIRDCHGREVLLSGGLSVKRAVMRVPGTVFVNADGELDTAPWAHPVEIYEVDVDLAAISTHSSITTSAINVAAGGLAFSATVPLGLSAASPRVSGAAAGFSPSVPQEFPRFGAAAGDSDVSAGRCDSPTGDIRFDNVTLTNATVTVSLSDYGVPADHHYDIPVTDLRAQYGQYDGIENFLGGSIMFGNTTAVVGTDGRGLQPGYDRENFVSSYSCAEVSPALAVPVSFDCDAAAAAVVSESPMSPAEIARLSVSVFAAVSEYIDHDRVCGFASVAVTEGGGQTLAGDDGGVEFSIDHPCRLSFSGAHSLRLDGGCEIPANQVATGSVTVVGTKTVRGLRTGSAIPAADTGDRKIIPVDPESASISLEITIEGLDINPIGGGVPITLQGGVLSGAGIPWMARDAGSGLCDLPTKVAGFSNIAHYGSTVSFLTNSANMDFAIDNSKLHAQRGLKNGDGNWLAGSISIDGASTTLGATTVDGQSPPADSQADGRPALSVPLDPDFDHDEFLRSFSCDPSMEWVSSADECSIEGVIAPTLARALANEVVAIAQLVTNDNTCGFSSPYVERAPPPQASQDQQQQQPGSPFGFPMPIQPPMPVPIPGFGSPQQGQPGQGQQQPPPQRTNLTQEVVDCAIGVPPEVEASLGTDCRGNTTYFSGGVNVTARRTIYGIPGDTDSGLVPESPTSTLLFFDRVTARDFEAFTVSLGSDGPEIRLRLVDLSFSCGLTDIRGESRAHPSGYTVPTPLARIDSLMAEGTVELEVGGKTVSYHLNDVRLNAAVGNYAGWGNFIAGVLSINGNPHHLDSLPLDHNFDQITFNSGYSCDPDLVRPL